ncbi:hypothetical protein E1B28_008739 [Marasmius oreades]|uniref:DNA polymerase V n=1 Tax=Marasmius oreades TaxID=181124 RepID=A0A9P7RZ55_9AGAR|nr:uncharacterized protein E1B28_008739 [Marasmius oreades]KAG7092382.1 hypothetical protein E1B28_008739 [Marasmius oreades]
MATTLPLFWHLSSASRDERLDASVKLIYALEQFQNQHKAPSPASDEEVEPTKIDTLDVMNAQDVSYSLRRLIRGLASPIESSRLGFSVALTELLSRLDTVTCSQISLLILEITKAQGASTGQEERDILFARLFGFTSIIQSGLLVRLMPLATSPSSATQASSLSSYSELLSQLVSLGEKKSWLRESTWWSIGLAIDALNESRVEWKEEACQATVRILFLENKSWSPEKIALSLKIQKLGWHVNWRPLLSPTFKDRDLLNNSNLQTIALILKEAGVEDESGDVQNSSTGSWKPQLHFAWDIILDTLIPSSNLETQKKSNFPEFFRIVVDENLFSANSSIERKYWGFQVFQRSLVRVGEDLMPMLFSKNFMRTWINHLSKKDRHLNKIATQTKFVENNPKLGFSLILQLTGVHGSQQFDRLTRTKTVEKILTTMDTAAIKQYIQHLLQQANDDAVSIETNNSRRQWVIDQLSALIRNGAIAKDNEWVLEALNWLVLNGLFVVKKRRENSHFIGLRKPPKPLFSDELRRHCREKLLSCLSDLTSQASVVQEGNSKVKAFGVTSDREFWVSKVLAIIQDLRADTRHVTPLVDIDEEVNALHEKAKQVVAKLKTVPDSETEIAGGTELLLSACMVQQYCAEDEEFTIPLEESLDAAARMFSLDKHKQKKGRKSLGQEEPQHEPIDVFADVIIGFLERSTAFMRAAGNQAFSLISSAAKESTIDLVLDQLRKRDPSEDDEETDDANPPDSDGAGEEEEEEEEEDETDSSSADGSSDDGEDSNDEPDEELRQQIMEALAVNGIQASTGETDDESEEVFMDDDQMMEIDQHLAEVFRMRLNEKKNGKDAGAEREAVHFKNRVLDLVDIFLKKRASNPLILRTILPLVDVATRSTPDEKQLSDKAQGIIRYRIGKHKELPSDADLDVASAVLKDLHERATNARSSEYLATLSDCSIYVSRLMANSGRIQEVLGLYRRSLSDFLTKKRSSLNYVFFDGFLRRFQSEAWCLRDDILTLSQKAVNAYRRCQALQLLHNIVAHLPTDVTEEVSDFMKKLQQTLLRCISEACDGKLNMTAPQMREILKLALSATRQTRKLLPTEMETIWNAMEWTSLSEHLAESTRFRGTVQMCRQITRLDAAVGTGSKRRKSHEGSALDGKKVKRKKFIHE